MNIEELKNYLAENGIDEIKSDDFEVLKEAVLKFKDLSKKTVVDLKDMCLESNIPIKSKDKKSNLINIILKSTLAPKFEEQSTSEIRVFCEKNEIEINAKASKPEMLKAIKKSTYFYVLLSITELREYLGNEKVLNFSTRADLEQRVLQKIIISDKSFVAKGNEHVEEVTGKEIIKTIEENLEMEKEDNNQTSLKFNAKDEQKLEKLAERIAVRARKDSNVIDYFSVNLELSKKFGDNYHVQLFYKLERYLTNKSIEIQYPSEEKKLEIFAYHDINQDIAEEEINYSIDTLLKGIETTQNSDEVKNFLSTINDYPLLSREKEAQLGEIISNALAKLEAGEELDFFENEEYEEARATLSLSNKRLVISVAKKYINRGMDLIDLIMEGMLGLEKAIMKYDYEVGFKFSTYATWWVRQGITRAIADKSKVIRVPVHMVETINKVTKIQRELTQKLGQEPTYEQIGQECTPKMSIEEVEHIFNIARDPIALETPIGDDNSSLESFIEDDKHLTQDAESEKNELRKKLLEIVAEIPEREGEVLLYRYGLYDLNTDPLKQRLIALREVEDLLAGDIITSKEAEESMFVKSNLCEKQQQKHGKRIAQNNVKFDANLRKITKYKEAVENKKDTVKLKNEYDKAIDEIENIRQSNIRYLEKQIMITNEQIEVLEKIAEKTGGIVKALTLEEVGDVFDVTRERIRQIETKGKRKLKSFVDKERLDLFIHD